MNRLGLKETNVNNSLNIALMKLIKTTVFIERKYNGRRKIID